MCNVRPSITRNGRNDLLSLHGYFGRRCFGGHQLSVASRKSGPTLENQAPSASQVYASTLYSSMWPALDKDAADIKVSGTRESFTKAEPNEPESVSNQFEADAPSLIEMVKPEMTACMAAIKRHNWATSRDREPTAKCGHATGVTGRGIKRRRLSCGDMACCGAGLVAPSSNAVLDAARMDLVFFPPPLLPQHVSYARPASFELSSDTFADILWKHRMQLETTWGLGCQRSNKPGLGVNSGQSSY
jgi:hypothetical protein